MTVSPWIADVTAESFRADVLERSMTLPVVVDFWAEWCGPCKALGPLLEKLALDGDGRFFLAKVDVDANPELAQMFQVQGIPMVVAIAAGRPVDGFTGQQSPAFLKDFIDRIAPATSGETVARAQELAASGDTDGALALLQERLTEKPGDPLVRAVLASIALDAGDATMARAVVEGLDAQDGPPELESVLRRLALVDESPDLSELEARAASAPEDLALRIQLGRALVAGNRAEEGLEMLLDVVERDRQFGEQGARKAMLEMFDALGDEHPLTGEFRRRLQMVLF